MKSTDDISELEAVLFDLGGTLIRPSSPPDESIFELFKSQLREGDPAFTFDDFVSLNRKYWRDMQNEFYSLKNEMSITEYNTRFFQSIGFSLESSRRIAKSFPDLVYQYEMESTEVIPNAHDLLKFMKSHGLKTGIISNTSHSKKKIIGLMEKVDILRYFDVVVVSSEAGIRKPDAGIFEIALKALDAKPENAIFIGDRYDYDAVGAQNAGMRWILLDEQTTLISILDLFKENYGSINVKDNTKIL